MEGLIARPRRPLSELISSDQGELSKLLDKFDMFREIVSRNSADSMKFAYLEHLLRISTPLEDSRSAIRAMLKNQQSKILPLLEKRNENLQDSLHNLEEIITSQDINTIRPVIKSTNYRWDGKKLLKDESDYQTEGRVPLCFTLAISQNYYILYTPNMTYVDGYDPFTGEKKIPLIPDEMLRIYSKGFYVLSNLKSAQCQTDFEYKPAKKKKKKGDGNESMISGDEGNQSIRQGKKKNTNMSRDSSSEKKGQVSFISKAKDASIYMDSSFEREKEREFSQASGVGVKENPYQPEIIKEDKPKEPEQLIKKPIIPFEVKQTEEKKIFETQLEPSDEIFLARPKEAEPLQEESKIEEIKQVEVKLDLNLMQNEEKTNGNLMPNLEDSEEEKLKSELASFTNVQNVKEENEEESEEESSSDEEGSEEETTNFQTTKTGELRSWEKYEKKATKKQRSRDQCAPMDGCEMM
ncbi:unnamed protein product [Blepharisma stoltei]|uniref:Uncharacterized protein n=1 Tax=Blepharisma stoltei TaxID=1481888 RepID=A0AAU9K8S8_9CILI|nr:unnamed protein product [Blepharisma stoltei]